MKRAPKYRNKPFVDADGIRWDSQAEYRRWSELKLLERAGQISGLERQVTVPLVVNGTKICAVRLDFIFWENGKRVWADCKSEFTSKLPVWRLKSKLIRALHPNVELRELK
jgi:hypothetical protein